MFVSKFFVISVLYDFRILFEMVYLQNTLPVTPLADDTSGYVKQRLLINFSVFNNIIPALLT